MDASEKLKELILFKAYELGDLEVLPKQSSDVSDQYEQLIDCDGHWDAESEVRSGEFDTEIECEWSRHFESKSVAAKCFDGSWVGWTYWYGGGKHSEPESIDWICGAYAIDCVEKEEVVTTRKFSKVVKA